MEKQQYAHKVVNLLDLGEMGMVEDALKFFFENKTMSSDETIRWTEVYGKVVKMVKSSITEYSNRNN